MIFISWNIQHCLKRLISLGQNSVLLGETSDAVVRFSHTSDFSADSIGFHCVQHATGCLVDISQVDLD